MKEDKEFRQQSNTVTFQFKTKEQRDAMTAEERLRYYQELGKEYARQQESLDLIYQRSASKLRDSRGADAT